MIRPNCLLILGNPLRTFRVFSQINPKFSEFRKPRTEPPQHCRPDNKLLVPTQADAANTSVCVCEPKAQLRLWSAAPNKSWPLQTSASAAQLEKLQIQPALKVAQPICLASLPWRCRWRIRIPIDGPQLRPTAAAAAVPPTAKALVLLSHRIIHAKPAATTTTTT